MIKAFFMLNSYKSCIYAPVDQVIIDLVYDLSRLYDKQLPKCSPFANSILYVN